MQYLEEDIEETSKSSMLLFKRLFTVKATAPTETLSLSMQNVEIMRIEFPDIWNDLVINAY